ncbi:hypothetical protein BR93DRAFT_260107 [Coniochaeta sp. PMI_546]|nr:hypothetical protein BR93DRAFT_260107 [Coniochaeta sp. PMI_546]
MKLCEASSPSHCAVYCGGTRSGILQIAKGAEISPSISSPHRTHRPLSICGSDQLPRSSICLLPHRSSASPASFFIFLRSTRPARVVLISLFIHVYSRLGSSQVAQGLQSVEMITSRFSRLCLLVRNLQLAIPSSAKLKRPTSRQSPVPGHEV